MNKMTRFGKVILNNLDTSLIFVLSIILIIGSVFGWANLTFVLSATLAILTILAFSIQRIRHTASTVTQALQEHAHSTAQALQAHTSLTEQALHELSGSITSLARNKAFETQEDAYGPLIEYINQYGAKEALFIQYSGHMSMRVLRRVLNKGARATLFIQHEDTAAKLGSQLQAYRIRESARTLRSDLGRNLTKAENLRVYKYTTPGTVDAIRIDNRVLCIGWYIYNKVDSARESQHYNHDLVKVSGHDVAAMIVWKGSIEFEVFNTILKTLEEDYTINAEEVQL